MANRRTRIIYASQSVNAEGRILYRVQTFGSTTTFNTTDYFELGQLNLTDVVDDAPGVAVTLDTLDYGSIYTMATLAKIPVDNLHHNIRQSDGTTFYGTVGAFGDTSNGDLDDATFSGLPAASGTGIANLVVKETLGGAALGYLHGCQLIDFARECGVSKGVDIASPIQAECKLGSADNEIEFTKFVKDVFINNIEMNYRSDDTSAENYAGETEQKQWFLNNARFLSWEEWHVGNLSGQVPAATMASKADLVLSLETPNVVATLSNRNLAFLKKDEAGRPAVLFTFVKGGGLTLGESKAVPVFSKNECIPTSLLEYFLYDSTDNTLEIYQNGSAATLGDLLPAARSAFINGDKIYVHYAANAYAVEIGGSRPVGADSSYVSAKYFAPISSDDVENVGGIRQGQVEAYLVDPDLILSSALTGATIGATSIQFSGTVASDKDLTKYVGLKLRVIDGPGKDGPAREIIGATNNLVGSNNNGTVNLGGSAWPSLLLRESSSQSSTVSGVYVNDLCGVDTDYVGSDFTVVVSGSPESRVIASVDVANKLIVPTVDFSDVPDDGGQVTVSTEPTAASTVLIGDYELALRLRNVTITSSLTREQLKEMGHLNPYARPVTLPIGFTVAIEATAGDLETFATFAGKLNSYKNDTLTDLDIVDLFAKDNLAVVVKVYQQTDQEAGGTGLDRKVRTADMFGDEYFDNGIRNVYTATDGTLRERPLKVVVAQNLRITDEGINTTMGQNASQTLSFRGTNEVIAIRGDIGIDKVTKVFESQS